MSRTVHVAMSIAAASQKPYGSRRRAFRPDTSNAPYRISRISGHMTGQRRGFVIFATSDIYPADTAA
jgi:hypothetical protein